MTGPTVVNHDLSLLAPRFRAVVDAAVAECQNLPDKLDVMVFEAFRSGERQAWLYAQGRTRPGSVVTHARSNLTSWHGYGLAIDVVHRTKFWNPFGSNSAQNDAWFARVGAVFKKHGCNWGGNWTRPDTPHMQWARCSASPSPGAITLVQQKGIVAVWDQLAAN